MRRRATLYVRSNKCQTLTLPCGYNLGTQQARPPHPPTHPQPPPSDTVAQTLNLEMIQASVDDKEVLGQESSWALRGWGFGASGVLCVVQAEQQPHCLSSAS